MCSSDLFLTSPQFLERRFEKTDIRSRIPWVDPACHATLKKAFERWTPLCETYSCSFAALVEAWALTQFDRMSLLVGMRKPQNVADTARCLEINLTPDEIRFMEEAVAPIQVAVLDQ